MQSTIEIASQLFGSDHSLQALKDMMSSALGGSNLLFFKLINDFLDREIQEFGVNLLGRTMAWVGSVVLVLMTIWIMIQGFRIITGQSRDSMMALVTNSLKATLIVGIATGWGVMGGNLFDWMGNGLQSNINEVVTGSSTSAYENIDKSLGYMQLAFSSIDAVQDGDSGKVDDAKSRAMWFTGIGTGGPAITAGVMLLLNKIAMALFIGLGPVFILALLFDQTKQLFSNWLFYGIGTMFSLAVLSVMVALALDVVIAVSASFWVGKLMGGSSEGVNSMAMQQGGLGLLLTMLIISAPPIAAQFFRGVLGSFTPYSGFNSPAGYSTPPRQQQQAGGGYQPGHPGYPGSAPSPNAVSVGSGSQQGGLNQQATPYTSGGSQYSGNDSLRTADQATRGNAGVQLSSGNVSTTANPPPQGPPAGAGGPPRGGTG